MVKLVAPPGLFAGNDETTLLSAFSAPHDTSDFIFFVLPFNTSEVILHVGVHIIICGVHCLRWFMLKTTVFQATSQCKTQAYIEHQCAKQYSRISIYQLFWTFNEVVLMKRSPLRPHRYVAICLSLHCFRNPILS